MHYAFAHMCGQTDGRTPSLHYPLRTINIQTHIYPALTLYKILIIIVTIVTIMIIWGYMGGRLGIALVRSDNQDCNRRRTQDLFEYLCLSICICIYGVIWEAGWGQHWSEVTIRADCNRRRTQGLAPGSPPPSTLSP